MAEKAAKEVIGTIDIRDLLPQLKAELRAEIMAELKKDAEEKRSKEEEANEAALKESDKKMKDILLAQPKKTIFIPEDPLNPDEAYTVVVNGVIFGIPRGIEVQVPESVAEVWKWSYEQTRRANNAIKVKEITELTVRD